MAPVEAVTICVNLFFTAGLAGSRPITRFLGSGDRSIELLEFGGCFAALLPKTDVGLQGSAPTLRLWNCGEAATEGLAARLVMTGLPRSGPMKRPGASGDLGVM